MRDYLQERGTQAAASADSPLSGIHRSCIHGPPAQPAGSSAALTGSELESHIVLTEPWGRGDLRFLELFLLFSLVSESCEPPSTL